MADPFKLPAIQQGVPIVDPATGMMTAYFSDWLNRVLVQVTTQINSINTVVTSLQAQQAQLVAQGQATNTAAQQAAAAQATADAGTPTGAKSGMATADPVNASGSGWVNGPQVDLTGVAAGNLTIPSSGPNQTNNTGINALSGILGQFTGNWRIQEIVGFVETTVFSGTYNAERDRDDQGIENILYNLTDTNTPVIPLTSTGAVSYRLDINAPGFDLTAVQLYLYVRRA